MSGVLRVSEEAAAAIRALVSGTDAPPQSGLRVVSTCENGMLGLILRVVDAPEPFDYTVDTVAVAVYVDPQALDLVDDQILDIAQTERGGYRFELRSQAVDRV